MAYKRISPIPVNEGGTGLLAITARTIMVGTGTTAPALVAPSVTVGVPLISQGTGSDPLYGTALVAGGGTGLATLTQYNVMIGAATANVAFSAPTATSGIPLVSTGNASNPSFGTAVVSGGGTGNTTFTAYSLICAGTTATGAFQNVVGLGSSGQVLVSAGAGVLPAWQNASSALSIVDVNNAASPYTVLTANDFLAVTTSGGAVTIRLPNAPTTGRVIQVKDSGGVAATSNITVTTVGGTVLIDGNATFVINTAYQSINVVFSGTEYLVF